MPTTKLKSAKEWTYEQGYGTDEQATIENLAIQLNALEVAVEIINQTSTKHGCELAAIEELLTLISELKGEGK